MAGTPQKEQVQECFAGFSASDHPRILADGVEWVIHGHRTTRGKAEFDTEIEAPGFSGSPDVAIEQLYEDGQVVVATGIGRGNSDEHGPFRFAFNGVFTFDCGRRGLGRLDHRPPPSSPWAAARRKDARLRGQVSPEQLQNFKMVCFHLGVVPQAEFTGALGHDL